MAQTRIRLPIRFKRPINQEESREQMLIVSHVNHKWPEALFTSALGGAMKTTIGQAVKFKRMGYRKSWPDLFFAEPRGPFHGLFIELKKTGGKLDNPDQEEFLLKAHSKGYKAVCCIGYQIAIKTIDAYLSMKGNDHAR